MALRLSPSLLQDGDMRRNALSFFVLLVASGCAARQPVPEMKETVTSFYDTYLAVRLRGIPVEDQQRRLAPFCSARLNDLLKEADRAEDRYYEATKGEVPPLMEGDVFTSLSEGATSFNVTSCEKEDNSCAVEFRYVESRESRPTVWKDKVYLVKESKAWLIDDIEYAGDWQFMHRGRLGKVLKGAIDISDGK
jgi:hypothetical protein